MSSKHDLEESKQSSYDENSDGDEDSSDEDECDKTDHGEYDGIFSKIELHTKWLSQLSPTLEQNLITAQKTRATQVIPCCSTFLVSTPAQYYVSLVRDRYKLADERLVERLGEANWQRHLNVRDFADEGATHVLDEHPAATSVFRPFSTFHDSGIGTSVNFLAEDTRSHTSFLSTESQSEVDAVRVPATPAEVQAGIPFECFLCKRTLSCIRNRVQWKMHIFSDLRPYICTFPRCQDELVQFHHRSDWADHEFKKHRTRKSWNCIACSERLTAVEEWEEHLQKVHDIRFTSQNLQAACRMALVEEERPAEQEECPLCRKVVKKSRRGFTAHVAHHMEQIALTTLPRDVDENNSDSCASSVEHASVDKSQEPVNIASGVTSEKIAPSSHVRRLSDRPKSPQIEPNYLVASRISNASDLSLSRAPQDGNLSDYLTDDWHSCPKCSTMFTSKQRADRKKNLRRHWDEKHTESYNDQERDSDSDIRPFRCFVEGCGSSYQYDRNLDKHGAKRHPEIRDWLDAKRSALDRAGESFVSPKAVTKSQAGSDNKGTKAHLSSRPLDGLHTLGVRLGDRYSKTGSQTDLDEAIQVARQAVDSTPDGNPDRAKWLYNLGIRLGDRYSKTGLQTDLDEAIQVVRQAVDSTPDDDPDRAKRLHNLGIGLGDRYWKTGLQTDLDEAIQIARQAVDSTLDDHPDRAVWSQSQVGPEAEEVEQVLEIPYYGTCAHCKHFYKNLPLLPSTDYQIHGRIMCPKCGHFMGKIGKTDTKLSLASVQSLPIETGELQPEPLQTSTDMPQEIAASQDERSTST